MRAPHERSQTPIYLNAPRDFRSIRHRAPHAAVALTAGQHVPAALIDFLRFAWETSGNVTFVAVPREGAADSSGRLSADSSEARSGSLPQNLPSASVRPCQPVGRFMTTHIPSYAPPRTNLSKNLNKIHTADARIHTFFFASHIRYKHNPPTPLTRLLRKVASHRHCGPTRPNHRSTASHAFDVRARSIAA